MLARSEAVNAKLAQSTINVSEFDAPAGFYWRPATRDLLSYDTVGLAMPYDGHVP